MPRTESADTVELRIPQFIEDELFVRMKFDGLNEDTSVTAFNSLCGVLESHNYKIVPITDTPTEEKREA